ncbi:hypothetical protein LIER_00387 [Lithospermum erythrorhizon]|uniref:Uncharacterized protein n=1 Tax=Lithospermum erythrorhizon TaxID=34254 RepID=A0AAV3NHY7_LITER
MTVGMPCIWTLQSEAKPLPTDIVEDLVVVARIQFLLPQGEDKLPWYAFTEEASLVMAGLVYVRTKVISYTNTDHTPGEVNFDGMVSDRPTLFTQVAITTKTKPRASMVPESSVPSILPPPFIPLEAIPSILKRLAREPPAFGSQPVKRIKVPVYKRVSQVLPQALVKEVTQPRNDSFTVVELDSSATFSNHYEERDLGTDNPTPPSTSTERPMKATETSPTVTEEPLCQRKLKVIATEVNIPPYDECYLIPPYSLPNLEVKWEAPWNTQRFHFHAVKPLLNKKVASRYTSLKDPFAAFSQSAKHITEVLNGAFVLAKRTDPLTQQNRNSEKKIEDLLLERGEREKLFNATEERENRFEVALVELRRVKEASTEAEKKWVAERSISQVRYRELEMSCARDLERTT